MQSSRPRKGLGGGRAVLLGLSILLGAALADAQVFNLRPPWSWLVPQVLFLALVGVIFHGIIRQRRLAEQVNEALEAVLLEDWSRAVPLLEQALAQPIRSGQGRCELLLALAAAARATDQADSAQLIYESILRDNEGDAIQLHNARVGLAEALLRTGQVTDAVTLIDRLTRADTPEPLKAHVELVSLLREVVMGQAADYLAAAQERRRLFRDHLSTRAGYGYGLLAAAFDSAGQADQAARYWHDATLLVGPAALLSRFKELELVAGRYAAAEVPL